ncbi:MAG: hypothetical protein IJP17_03985 [Clostridia bacterium]|nr:hypothetical protein [Clostridia bacterium]
MKKFLAVILAVLMLLSVTACGGKDDSANNASGTDAGNVIAPTVEAGTLGETMWNAFVAAKAENPAATTEELANTLITNPAILFMGGALPVEEGLLSGFGNYEVKGFTSGAMVAPMMSSIAFVGYVFELEEGADKAAFIAELQNNCDPAWNICVIADQTVIGAVDNTVFFLMCPNTLDSGEPASEDAVVAE